MNTIQERNYDCDHAIIILVVTVLVMSLLCIHMITNFHQIALAKDGTNSSSNTGTDKAANQNAESLVRSIMDPSSLMSSVINETGGTSSQSSHTSVKNLTGNDNINNNNQTSAQEQSQARSGNSSASAQASSDQLSSDDKLQRNITQDRVTRNVDTLMLAHQIIPPRDFLHLYGTDPYIIKSGHISAKIPCDANSSSSLQMLVGHLPQLKPLQLDPIKELSKPGYLCMYEGNVGSPVSSNATSIDAANNNLNTDLILLNPTDYRIILPNTSTVVISVEQGPP
jgi:hypothetical protein